MDADEPSGLKLISVGIAILWASFVIEYLFSMPLMFKPGPGTAIIFYFSIVLVPGCPVLVAARLLGLKGAGFWKYVGTVTIVSGIVLYGVFGQIASRGIVNF